MSPSLVDIMDEGGGSVDEPCECVDVLCGLDRLGFFFVLAPVGRFCARNTAVSPN